MKKVIYLFIFIFTLSITKVSAQLPKLSAKEAKQGWVLLFDGKSTQGWKRSNGDAFPDKNWKIVNGVLSVDPSQGRGFDIITIDEFSDFDLTLEFKLTESANSGIKYFLFKNTSLGCEFQILDDAKHPDAKLGKNGNRLQAGLYDLIAPDPKKRDKPIGSWNKARIVSKGKHVEHWLNGKKVVEYERGGELFRQLVAESKYKNDTGFGEIEKSPILLQFHGDIVSFRNIKIKNL
jgi:hypothetical protein